MPSTAPKNLDFAWNRREFTFLLGSALTRSKRAKDAVPHYRETVRILETIAKENGAARVLEREDVSGMYHDAMKSFQGI